MSSQLDRVTSLDWSFFDAASSLPNDLAYRPDKARWMRRRELTPGELGCFASHVGLWRWLCAAPDATVLCVLEDDLIIDTTFFEHLAAFAPLLEAVPYLRLYAKVPMPFTRLGSVPGGRYLVRFHGSVFGTQGYLLNKSGAERLLSSIGDIVRPIDDEMDRFWHNKVPIYGIFPFPVIETGFPSTIEAARRAGVSLSPAEKLLNLSYRAGEKSRRSAANLALGARDAAIRAELRPAS